MTAVAAAPPAHPSDRSPIERRELGAGCALLLVRDDAVPLVHLHLGLDAGADRDPAGREGLAMASVELLALATERAAVEAGGGDLLAHAGWTSATLAVEALSDDLPAALDALEALLERDACDGEALARWAARRAASLAAIAGAAPALADLALARSVYGGRREALPLGGTRRSLGALATADVVAFRRAARRRPWTVTAVGTFEAEPLTRRVAGWPGLPASTVPARAVPARNGEAGTSDGPPGDDQPPADRFAAPGAAGLLVDVPEAERAEVRVGAAVDAGATDLARLRLLARLVGERLQGELRGRGGLTYHVRAGLRRRRTGGLWSVATAVEPEEAGRAVAAVDATLADLAAAAPPAAEVEAARRAHLVATLIGRESLGGLAAAVARARDADDELEGVEEATGDDLRRLAARLAAARRLAIAGPADRLFGSFRDGLEAVATESLLDGVQPEAGV